MEEIQHVIYIPLTTSLQNCQDKSQRKENIQHQKQGVFLGCRQTICCLKRTWKEKEKNFEFEYQAWVFRW